MPPGIDDHAAVATTTGRLVIVGAGGFGREVIDIVDAMNVAGADLELLGSVDDSSDAAELLARRGVAHLGSIDAFVTEHAGNDVRFVIGIGAGSVRRRIDARLSAAGFTAATLVHPMATVGGDNRFGAGVILAAGARVTTNITLGRHTHLHVNATVGHDSILSDFVSVFPGATVSGSTDLHDGSTIGTGGNVLPGRTVGARSTVGAGAVVTVDVAADVTVAGVPARVLHDAVHA